MRVMMSDAPADARSLTTWSCGERTSWNASGGAIIWKLIDSRRTRHRAVAVDRGKFMLKLLTTWASVGFRTPRIAGVPS